MTACLGLILLTALAQEKPPPGGDLPALRVDFGITVEETGPQYSFVLSGTTNLSDDALLQACVYYVDENDGSLGDLVVEGKYASVTVKDGAFRTAVYAFPRKPFCTRYTGRVIFKPGLQNRLVRNRIASRFDGIAEKKFDVALTYGTKEEFEAQKKESSRRLKEDFDLLRDCLNQVKTNVLEHQKDGFDRVKWYGWKGAWLEKVEDLDLRNRTRLDSWVYPTEKQGRMAVDELLFNLEKLCDRYEKRLRGDGSEDFPGQKDETIETAVERFEGFLKSYRAELELAATDLEERENALVRISTLAGKIEETIKDGDVLHWKNNGGEIKKQMSAALLKLSETTPKSRARTVSDLAESFNALYEACDRLLGRDTPEGGIEDARSAMEDFKGKLGDVQKTADK